MDLSIYDENNMNLLSDLADRIKKGNIAWDNIDYNPLAILQTENEDGTNDYILTHIFSCSTDISQLTFDIELSESIDILSRKGDIFLTVTQSGAAGFDMFDMSLSSDLSYDDVPAEKLSEFFKDHPALVFADALINELSQNDAVEITFEWARFCNQEIPESIEDMPLYILGEHLFKKHDALSFHKCVLDCEFRKGFF